MRPGDGAISPVAAPTSGVAWAAHAAVACATVCAVLLSVVAGCAGAPIVAGRPVAVPSSGVLSSVEPTAAASSSVGTSADGLTAVAPCALVPDGVRARLGLSDPVEKAVGEARVCRLRVEGSTLRRSYTVGVELFTSRGLDALVAERAERLPDVGRHPAVRFTGSNGGCGVALGVGGGARVDVTAVGGDIRAACGLVTDLATAIEPAIPSG